MSDLPDIPFDAGEAAAVDAFLAYQRAVFARKTAELDAAGMRTTLGPSTMTLGGMLAHLAFVEDYWFGYVLLGARPAAPFDAMDWEADPDADWRHAHELAPHELRGLWADAVARSREARAGVALDQLAARDRHGEAPNLRWILLHMIEEYARHLGHADLLRESIDGATGD